MTDAQGPSGGVSPYGEGGRSGDGVSSSPGPEPSTGSPSYEVSPAAYGPAPVVRAPQRLGSPVTSFLVPNDVGEMRAATGRPPWVSALWGLWVLLPLFGPVIWFVKVQGLLNDYWESRGAAH